MFRNKTKHIAWILVAILTISCFGNVFGTFNVIAAENNTQTMLRLFNPNTGEHLYTGDESEKDLLVGWGWQYEGEAWISPLKSNTPVYRLYNQYSSEHHYTIDVGERNWLITSGWNDEGIGWYSSDTRDVPVYREFNPYSTGVGAHNYTTNMGEHTYLITSGWNDEGIAWYGSKEGPVYPDEPVLPEEPDIVVPDSFTTSENIPITELNASKKLADIKGQNGVEPFGEYWIDALIPGDISDNLGLAYSLTVGDNTTFAKDSYAPKGYDINSLIEWGKDPGLGVNILKQQGYTGEGAVIAYIDQPILNHEQYDNGKLHYINNSDNDNSMHGPAVLSLLQGKDIGTAPDAEVYFYAHSAWKLDQTTHAECLYQIIEQNKSLPDDKKIKMVAFSDNIDESEKNADAFREAVKKCEDSGVMVWFCGDYAPLTFIPNSDKNNYNNISKANWYEGGSNPELVFVPSSGRTTAVTSVPGANYIYWGNGGLSWTMPYVFGLYADAIAIDPSLTKDDLRKLIVDTAYVDSEGKKIVNPVNFIATVLKKVGRTKDANKLLDAQNASKEYLYAIINTSKMTSDDVSAIKEYLANITDKRVLLVDAARASDAKNLYAAIKADAKKRGGNTAGVQIFGTSTIVPTFNINYKVLMYNGQIDEGGEYQTDLFYGNFNNAASDIADGYSVYDHLTNEKTIRLTPKWPVARLTLNRGEFKSFLDKYDKFAVDTNLIRQDIVNFSNPIFASSFHQDDMGMFLNRAHNEFGILDTTYRLYGNLKGDYPVETDVIGGFTKEEIGKENKKDSCEYIINSHGQPKNIDNAFFIDDVEQRESFLNTDTINNVLNTNPYYLDTWTCNNGYRMEDNLTTTALNGKCVGVFSATTIISNNGVRNYVSLEDMTKSNFYYFYYAYLKALNEGKSRSDAFFVAQKAYGTALYADTKEPLRGEGNVQFNMNNLLTYHNFGLIEENAVASAFCQ